MIVCPNCQHKNVTGAMFCAECGAQLDGVDTLITQAITDEQIAEELSKKTSRPEPATPANTSIAPHSMPVVSCSPLASAPSTSATAAAMSVSATPFSPSRSQAIAQASSG